MCATHSKMFPLFRTALVQLPPCKCGGIFGMRRAIAIIMRLRFCCLEENLHGFIPLQCLSISISPRETFCERHTRFGAASVAGKVHPGSFLKELNSDLYAPRRSRVSGPGTSSLVQEDGAAPDVASVPSESHPVVSVTPNTEVLLTEDTHTYGCHDGRHLGFVVLFFAEFWHCGENKLGLFVLTMLRSRVQQISCQLLKFLEF